MRTERTTQHFKKALAKTLSPKVRHIIAISLGVSLAMSPSLVVKGQEYVQKETTSWVQSPERQAQAIKTIEGFIRSAKGEELGRGVVEIGEDGIFIVKGPKEPYRIEFVSWQNVVGSRWQALQVVPNIVNQHTDAEGTGYRVNLPDGNFFEATGIQAMALGRLMTEPGQVALEVAHTQGWLSFAPKGGTLPVPPMNGNLAEENAYVQQYAQSLSAQKAYQVLGHPRSGADALRVSSTDPRGQFLAGWFEASVDKVSVIMPNSFSEDGTMDGTLWARRFIHELAHHFQATMGNELDALWKREQVGEIPEAERLGHGNKLEHQAEAISLAWEFLQTSEKGTAADKTMAGKYLSDIEAKVPGTKLMTRALLTHPNFKKHPLNTGKLGAGLETQKLNLTWSWQEVAKREKAPLYSWYKGAQQMPEWVKISVAEAQKPSSSTVELGVGPSKAIRQ